MILEKKSCQNCKYWERKNEDGEGYEEINYLRKRIDELEKYTMSFIRCEKI